MKGLGVICLTLFATALAAPAPQPAHPHVTKAPVLREHVALAGSSPAQSSPPAKTRKTPKATPKGTPSKNPKGKPSKTFLSTATDAQNGEVVGCTALTTATSLFTAAGTTYTPGGVYCNGGPVISTNTAAINTSISGAYTPGLTTQDTAAPFSKPTSGCVLTTTEIASPTSGEQPTQTYCACANGDIAGYNVFVSRTSATTICAETGVPTPTGWVLAPSGPGAPDWAQNATGDCALNGPTVSSSCWDELDIAGYVGWWWQSFNGTCDGLGFGDCFYAQQTKYAPSNCTQTGPNQPCTQPVFDDFRDSRYQPARDFLVAWNIWNMGSFFSKYWLAIGDSSTIASEGVGKIADQIDPPKNTNVGFNELMLALAVGLSFVGAPEGAPALGALITATQQAPGIARYFVPQGNTAADQKLDFDNVQASLGDLTNQFQNSISQGLVLLLNDQTNFVQAGGNGAFSGQQPGTNDLKNQILPGLYTYIVAQIYAANGVIVTRAPNTDVNALSSNGTDLEWKTGCGNGYGQYGECDTFYFDKTNGTTYALTNPGNLKTNYNDDMQTIFNGYTTGDLLLQGADACAQAHANNTGGIAPGVGDLSQGPSAITCLSSLPICTWNTVYQEKGADVSTDCSYGDGSDPLGKLVGPLDQEVTVPIQYIGYGIIKANNDGNNAYPFTTDTCGDQGTCN